MYSSLGIAVYIVAVISIVGTICASALNSTSHAEGGYFVVSLSICLCTTVTLMLVFLPKVIISYFIHDVFVVVIIAVVVDILFFFCIYTTAHVC